MQTTIFDATRFTILDGGMGTMVQPHLKAGESPALLAFHNPQLLLDVHKSYIDAGAQVILANTFSANAKKLEGTGHSTADVIAASVQIAQQACEGTGAIPAVDIGPLGELLAPVGTLSFEEAYSLFAEVAIAAEKAGAQVAFIETMTDLLETKAAVLAVKENTTLPICVSMTFEKNGRTFSGTAVENFALTIGSLGVQALGINCSLGPADIMPLAQRLCDATPLPVFVKANAGLPDPLTGAYSVGPNDFAAQLEPCLISGVSMLGGCCGTTPATIAAIAHKFGSKTPATRTYIPQQAVCSAVRIADYSKAMAIGERINPTGKKRMQAALAEEDYGYLQAQAVAQQQSGAAILDVNVGAPGIDEVAILPRAVQAVQAVSDLPLQLDSANPAALEAALRIYNGKAIVNSTSGEQEKLETVLPLCKKYGAAVVGLTLDEDGIPETASARFAIAQKIIDYALSIGIPREDVLIDCLVLPAGATEGAAVVTLNAVQMVANQLGVGTVLGVSNVSFGLPNRPLINQTFLTMALQAGLRLPILNPANEGMMGAIAAYNMLHGDDPSGRSYVEKYSDSDAAPVITTAAGMSLQDAIRLGLKAEARTATKALLSDGTEGLAIVDHHLIPALDVVGSGFEAGTLFLPQLLSAADAAGVAFEVIRETYGTAEAAGPPVVIATVEGDIHDIGKNIAKVLLQNYGFTVIDLGRDVPVQKVVDAAKQSGTKLVGLSALMTTTLPAMEATINALREAGLDCQVLVAGAVLTESYAQKIGADFYAKDARASVAIAQKVYGL